MKRLIGPSPLNPWYSKTEEAKENGEINGLLQDIMELWVFNNDPIAFVSKYKSFLLWKL